MIEEGWDGGYIKYRGPLNRQRERAPTRERDVISW
jgi:hypothetical protein